MNVVRRRSFEIASSPAMTTSAEYNAGETELSVPFITGCKFIVDNTDCVSSSISYEYTEAFSSPISFDHNSNELKVYTEDLLQKPAPTQT